jgi:hypothetical protein
MAQLTPSQARVIDPILTTVAQGYKNNELIGSKLFPQVPVNQRGGKILSFGREDFRLYNTARSPGASTKRVQFGYAGLPYALESHSLEGLVPIENMQEANEVPGIDLGTASVTGVQNIIALRKEKAQADLATTAANYQAANKTTLSGTSKWSDYTTGVSNPTKDIEVAKEAVRAATGKRGNVVAIGAQVWQVLRQHPLIIDRIKFTGRDSATPDMLAKLWQVDEVVVGDAIYEDSTGAIADVWGNFVVVAYTNTASAAQRGAPSFGYTYQLGGYPLVEQAYFDRNQKSWIYPVTDEVAPVIAAANAGYLITGPK